MVNPILKWPGGKRTLTSTLLRILPDNPASYYEPFLGGGALFFTEKYTQAHLSDVNHELVNFYTVVRNNLPELLEELKSGTYVNTKETYLTIRNWDREDDYETLSPVRKAARLLYLNKTCFNGLYRVNKKGIFNTSYGYYENPVIVDEVALEAVSGALQNNALSIEHESYEKALTDVQEGDVVYLDPPYIPMSVTADFTSYAKDKFYQKDQENLARIMLELDSKGAFVVCSNSSAPLTYEIYDKFTFLSVNMARRINKNGAGRGAVKELLIVGDRVHDFLKKERPEVLNSFVE